MRTSMLHAALVVAVLGIACSDDTTGPVTSWTATLRGGDEVPAVTTSAGGSATVSISGLSLTYTITITGTPTSNIQVAHIHTANTGSTGPVRVNLCGTGTPAPACPTGAGSVASTTVTYASGTTAVLGSNPSMTYDGLVTAIRGGGAYVNVHTVNNGGGEIRGQLLPVVP